MAARYFFDLHDIGLLYDGLGAPGSSEPGGEGANGWHERDCGKPKSYWNDGER